MKFLQTITQFLRDIKPILAVIGGICNTIVDKIDDGEVNGSTSLFEDYKEEITNVQNGN